MQACLYLLFNALLTALLLYSSHDPSRDYMAAPSELACITEPGLAKSFCAVCVHRGGGMLASKGFVVQSEDRSSILRMRQSSELLSCKDYLQFANYEQAKPSFTAPRLETLNSIQELVTELQGSLDIGVRATEVIPPQFKALVVYRWFELTQEKSVKVRIPNEAQVKALQHIFFYVINAVGSVLLATYLYNKNAFSHLKPKNLMMAAVYFALVEWLTYSSSTNEAVLHSIRVAFLTMLLMRIDTNKMVIICCLLLGILAGFFPLIFMPYALLVLAAAFARGFRDQNITEIWSYLMLTLVVYVGDHAWWSYSFSEIADNQCRMVELGCLSLAPLGLLFIRDLKYVGFDIYKPAEQKKNAISLSGYEDEDEDDDTPV